MEPPDQREDLVEDINRLASQTRTSSSLERPIIPACSQNLEILLVRPGFVVKRLTAILGTGEGIQKPPAVVMVKIVKAPGVAPVQRNSLALCCEEAFCGLNLGAMLFAHLVCALLRVPCSYVHWRSVSL